MTETMDAAPPAAGNAWPELRSGALDWLVHGAKDFPYLDDVLVQLSERLVAEGMPLERTTLHMRVLHPQFMGARMLWRPGFEKAELFLVGYEAREDPRFTNNPIWALYEGAEGIRQRLDVTDPADDTYGIYGDLREQGMTDYVALPLVATDGRRHASTWSTKRPGGFSTEHLRRLSDLVPVLTLAAEVRLNRRLAKNLLNTYVGERAGERVLAGDIVRGSGATIRAAIWNCDLRSFTRISELWPRDDVIGSLNEYFDAMGEPVTRNGGEILKFIGDGMLAIFPIDEPEACRRALASAAEARREMIALNERRAARGAELLGYGLALHVGDVMYGNIGTATRLDFTVIGPAVNTAARLEGLTKILDRRVLVSGPFAHLCGRVPDALEPLGSFPLRGVGEPLEVYGLVEDR